MFPYSKKHCFVGRHELQLIYEPESVCGDLVPSLEAGKEAVRKATGVTRVCEWGDGVPARSLFVRVGLRGGEGVPQGQDNAPLICNHTTIIRSGRPSQQPRLRAREMEERLHVVFIGVQRA